MSAAAPVAVALRGRGFDNARVGGKAAAIDRLVAWGLPVPAAAAVTTEYYRLLAADPAVTDAIARARAAAAASGPAPPAEVLDAAFLAARVERAVDARVAEVAAAVGGGGALAVRSSATVEDLEHASFAGQYRSFLAVDADRPDAVVRAVRLVLASLWYPAPCAYRRAFGVDDRHIAMGVLLMRMVDARQAGVAFTVDPADPGRARVESVDGLGEALVSGQRTPRVFRVPRAGRRSGLPVPVAAALDLAMEVEGRAGVPQDVEWAWDGTRTWVVQARPISVRAGGAADDLDDPPQAIADLDLTTAGIAEMVPGVLAPLVWDTCSHLIEEAFRVVLDELGVLPPGMAGRRVLLRRVRGRAAMDFGLLAAMGAALPGSVDLDLEVHYFAAPGDRTSVRRGRASGIRGKARAARHDVRVLRIHRRAAFESEVVVRVARAFDDVATPDFEELDARQLAAHQLRLLDLGTRAMAAELSVAAGAAAAYHRLEAALARHVGPVAAVPLAQRLTARGRTFPPPSGRASAAVFGAATWAERAADRAPGAPGETGDAAGDGSGEAAGDGSGEAAAGAAAVEGLLVGALGVRASGTRGALRVRALARLAGEAAEQLARRERTKGAVLRIGGEVRALHLACGRRLADRGVLADAGEVELLTVSELRAALAGGPAPVASVLGRRRRWSGACTAAGSLPVRFRGVPPIERTSDPGGTQLRGWPASPGSYTGAVQVVRDPRELLVADRVLVAEATDASWSPLFARAGAIVLERGGPLSHAAILARELGVPAVLNVVGATHLRDGVTVTVDGDAGLVSVHDAERAPPHGAARPEPAAGSGEGP